MRFFCLLALAAQGYGAAIEPRKATCAFPHDQGLIPVTPGEMNGGWAMAPNMECSYSDWCPYVCPSGMLSAQWEPGSSDQNGGQTHGGLFCNKDGTVSKGRPEEPYCYNATGRIGVLNTASSGVAVCQTVKPGYEDMLIPNHIPSGSRAALAIPNETFWNGIGGHYYVNAPGIPTEKACTWGSSDKPWGNWSPYTIQSQSAGDNTWLTISWNPIWLEEQTPFRNKNPSFGMSVDCVGSGCLGASSCVIDPSTQGINNIPNGIINGLGYSACHMTVAGDSTANVIVFDILNSERWELNEALPASVSGAEKKLTSTDPLATSDGRCGLSSSHGGIDARPNPNPPMTCSGSAYGLCCSQYGWCGGNASYCATGCQSKFGTCW